MSELRITMNHVLSAGGCARGARRFYRKHGLDFKEFMSHGTSVLVLEQIDDAMVKKVIEVARGQQQ